MADNLAIQDGVGVAAVAATDELSDNSQSPKVTLLSGDGTPTSISPATTQGIGATNESAAATDTATSGLNGRLQRVAQRLTSLIALLPTSLGGKTAAASFPVVLSSDGPFAVQTGSITETAPASDTASSGINGRLQRIAQRITSLIALLPTSLGVKAAASSLAVTLSTENAAVLAAPSTGTITSVADSASDGPILASNASRKGATIWNDSTETLYVALSNVTSSTIIFTAKIEADGYYELPIVQGGVYTGVIKGIWANNASGSARVTEFT